MRVLNNILERLQKAPPGPKPSHFREEVGWDDQRRRWVLPPERESPNAISINGDDDNVDHKNYDGVLQQIGQQMGSVSGGLFQDVETGDRAYIKFPGRIRAQVETLAAKLYKAADIPVPEINIISFRGDIAVKSDWLNDAQPMSYADMAYNSDVRRGFLVDAWLANWDVVGGMADNVVDVDGTATRIDVGGALIFRAQGGIKAFEGNVPEIESMRDTNVSWYAADVFHNLSKEELIAGAESVSRVTEDTIDLLVDGSGLPDGAIPQYPGFDNIKDFLRITLKQRRNTIIERFL